MIPILKVTFSSTFLRAFLPESVPLRHHGRYEVVVFIFPLGRKTNRVWVTVAAGRKYLRRNTRSKNITCNCRAPAP